MCFLQAPAGEVAEDDGEHGKTVIPFGGKNSLTKQEFLHRPIYTRVPISESNKNAFFFPGGLVRKILETKKELEGGGNQEARPKQVGFR